MANEAVSPLHDPRAFPSNEACFRALVENVFDVVTLLDAQGRVLYASPNCARLLGDDASSVTGSGGFDGVHPDDRAAAREGFARILSDPNAISRHELRLRQPDGAWRWVEITARNLLHHPAVQALVVSWRDLTERKRAEEQQATLDRQLRETQKLESLGVLAGGIAHSFNNLLTTIIGFASLAGIEMSAASPVQSYLQEIQRAAAQAADMCRQMLAYAGKGRYMFEPLDLNRVVRETTELLQLSLPQKGVLRLHLADNLPVVRADPTGLRQLVGNLVRNAAEALGEQGGSIDVRTGVCEVGWSDLADAHRGPDVLPGRYVVLEVRDNGCGMTAETKGRIFEPFFSTKFIGRGLGLAAASGILRGHRGAVKVESAPGTGATFRVFLPCAGEDTSALLVGATS